LSAARVVRRPTLLQNVGVDSSGGELNILPRCELLQKCRYDQEIISHWWGRKLKINSREVEIWLW
jgi:hypothetical protein